MQIKETNLRLLRIFRAVVGAGGFSNSQVMLGLSPSTISTQMSQLESLLGYTLCERGRSGFKLTDKGEHLYRYTNQLFESLGIFENQANELRGGLNGNLRIGLLDNVITDKNNPLSATLAKFTQQPNNNIKLSLDVLSPREMERGLLDKSIDLAIGIFNSHLSALKYRAWYYEEDVLVCHRDHPIASMVDARAQALAIPMTPKVVRTFLSNEEFPFADSEEKVPDAAVSNVEAAALLILTAVYIGFLPRHYALSWVQKGEMVEILPGKFSRGSHFSLVTSMNAAAASSAVLAFLACADIKTNESAKAS
jgi:DNA-binding transcriptional LysR family regulator